MLGCKWMSLFFVSLLSKSPTIAFALLTMVLPIALLNTVSLLVGERKEACPQTAPKVSALQTKMPPVPTGLEPHLSNFIYSLFVSVRNALWNPFCFGEAFFFFFEVGDGESTAS